MNVNYDAAEAYGVVTVRELRVFHLVHIGAANEVRTISAHMRVSKPAITRALYAIEYKGFGKRGPLDDKRCMVFSLTDEGKRVAREIFDV